MYISRGGGGGLLPLGCFFADPFLAVEAESWIAESWAMCYGNPLLHGLISRGGGSGGPPFCTATYPGSLGIAIMYIFCCAFYTFCFSPLRGGVASPWEK